MIFDILAKFDYETYPAIKRSDYSNGYEYIKFNSRYSPWHNDSIFQETYDKVKNFTLVDKYRCYELWNFVGQTATLDKGSLIEIGVWKGGTGGIIAQQAKNCNIPDPVYLCDTFTGVVKTGKEDSFYADGTHADTSCQVVENLLLRSMQLNNIKILEGIFPEQTAHCVENSKFRFCHIDVDVYQSAEDIVTWIWDKMVSGGIIVYDDYGFYGCDGITKHVERQRSKDDRLVIHNLNGHAVIVKIR